MIQNFLKIAKTDEDTGITPEASSQPPYGAGNNDNNNNNNDNNNDNNYSALFAT